MTIVVRNMPDCAEITLAGPIQASSIYPICDTIDQAVEQFYYDHVRFRISSDGGETKSLRYMLSQMEDWHRRGVTIETIAMTECSSAAAVMLSMGTRGHRYADMKHSRLMWHFARMPSDAVLGREVARHPGGLTARAGDAVAKQLSNIQEIIKRDDDFMVSALMKHICGGNVSKPDDWLGEEFLRRKYHLQQRREQMISDAAQYACHWTDRDEKSIRILWDQLYRETYSPDVAAAFLEVELRTMLDQDRNCSPLEAWMLFLIDDLGGSHND